MSPMGFYNRSANRKAHFHPLNFAGISDSKMRALSLVSPALERAMVTITWLEVASDLMSPSGSLDFLYRSTDRLSGHGAAVKKVAP
jgi:hypothetical protein